MPKWISVKDRLPPDYHEVLYCATFLRGNKELMTGHREKGDWTHCCMFYSTMRLNDECEVTHWMELPQYPTETQCTHKDINMEPAYQCEDCKQYGSMD